MNNVDPLTHISRASFLWDMVNSAKPDQMPQNALSDQVLHCFLTDILFKCG